MCADRRILIIVDSSLRERFNPVCAASHHFGIIIGPCGARSLRCKGGRGILGDADHIHPRRIFRRVHKVKRACDMRESRAALERCSVFRAFGRLLRCRDDDYAIRSARTIDCRGTDILEDRYSGDVRRVDFVKVGDRIDNAVHHNQWFVTGRDGACTTNLYAGALPSLSASGNNVNPGNPALKSLCDRGHRRILHILNIHDRHGSGEVLLLGSSVADDD